MPRLGTHRKRFLSVTRSAILLTSLLLAAALVPAAAAAQGRDTGALQVTILDPKGAPIPGGRVRLQGPQNELLATTDLKGVAGFRGLAPGEYAVLTDIAGFRRLRRDGLVVTTGRSTQVTLEIQVAGIEESLVVTGASPLVDARSVGVGVTVGSELVNLTPSGAGLWGSVLDKVPGVVLSGVDVGGSRATGQQAFGAHGALLGQTQFNLNGTDTRDFRSGAAGMFYSVPSFAEVVVSTAAHDIEYQSPGVIISMVSKSGGNRLHGGARLYYSDESLASDNVSDELIEQGVRRGNPNTLLADLDLQVGGPLVHDKLWGFFDYWRFNEERLIIGVVPEERDERSLRNVTTNLDWQLTDDQRLSFRYFYSTKYRLNISAAANLDPSVASLQDPSRSNVFQVNWLSTWGEHTYADIRTSVKDLVFGFVGRSPESAAPHPDYPLGVPTTYDFFTGIWSGMPRETRVWDRSFQLNGSVSHYVPGERFSHDLKIRRQLARVA